MSKLATAAVNDPLKFALAAGLVLGVVYFIGKQVLQNAAAAAGGIVSGRNALTEGTAYDGAGIFGTVGAAADTATGGTLSTVGSSIGSWLYDVFHDEYDPNTGIQKGANIVRTGAENTDYLWGPIGSIALRRK